MMGDFFSWLFGLDPIKADLNRAKVAAEAAKVGYDEARSQLTGLVDWLTFFGKFALFVAILCVVVPPIWRFAKWVILSKNSLKPVHFLDGGPGGPDGIQIDIRQGRYPIDLQDGHPGLFVRPESWVQHPESATFEVPKKRQLFWSRYKNDLYWLYKIRSGKATLETPYHGAHLGRVIVPAGDRLIIKLRHVVAFSCNTFPFSTRRQFFNIPAYVQRLTKCTYFKGPAELYIFGIDGIEVRNLREEEVYLKSSTIIGWTPRLKVSIATRETLLASIARRREIAQTCFQGEGVIISQSLAGDSLEREEGKSGNNSWWQLLIEIIKPF